MVKGKQQNVKKGHCGYEQRSNNAFINTGNIAISNTTTIAIIIITNTTIPTSSSISTLTTRSILLFSLALRTKLNEIFQDIFLFK